MSHLQHEQPRRRPDVLVVGGGIIGLTIAWRARQAGMSVTLAERDALGRGTSRVAAGMLAPVAEVEFGAGGRRLLELGLRSAGMWPGFASELEGRAGESVGMTSTGTLLLARDEDDARELERQLEFRRSLDLSVTRLRPSEAREREPALAPTVRMALEAPDDHSVDPRRVLAALSNVCVADGVELRTGVTVARVELGTPSGAHAAGGRRAIGVSLSDGERLEAEHVVLAAGPWSEHIGGLPDGAGIPVRPVKGQILRLRDPAGPGLLSRVLRFRGGYMVPREDGGYVLGATVEERGYELAPTAGGVYELLRDAHELVPGISELHIEELSVGLRPGTPDNAPAIGPGAVPGLVWATGHYRNGILLAPLTAELVVGVLAGDGRTATPGDDAKESLLAACAPGRFAAPGHAPAGGRAPAPGGVPAPARARAGASTHPAEGAVA